MEVKKWKKTTGNEAKNIFPRKDSMESQRIKEINAKGDCILMKNREIKEKNLYMEE